MRYVVSVLVIGFMTISQAMASQIVSFSLTGDGSDLAGDTFTLTETGLVADGVSFDATLTVTGSGTLTQTSSTGLGVSGERSDLVSNGQYLTLSISVSNPDVTFDGFTNVLFGSFGTNDEGYLSVDSSGTTTSDNFYTKSEGAATTSVDLTPLMTLPRSFSAIAKSEGSGTNTFRLESTAGQFSAVPEPSSFLFMSMLALAAIWRRRCV